jgi:hypothetical protein
MTRAEPARLPLPLLAVKRGGGPRRRALASDSMDDDLS